MCRLKILVYSDTSGKLLQEFHTANLSVNELMRAALNADAYGLAGSPIDLSDHNEYRNEEAQCTS